MTSETRIIRDFIYVDAEKLYSLYSQVFEGVAEQIVESFIRQTSDEHLQKGFLGSGKSVETQVAETSLLTQNKLLYDHMYNKLEDSLRSAIWDSRNTSANSWRQNVQHGSLVKVYGTVEIQDYQRLNEFMGNFNKLGEAIAYIVAQPKQYNVQIKEIEEQIKNTKERNKKAALKLEQKRIKEQKNSAVQNILEKGNLQMDEDLIKELQSALEIFNVSGYEIIIEPKTLPSPIVFRGLLDRRWLRLSPDYIRALYGGRVNTEWVMVGQVTFIPSRHTKPLPQQTTGKELSIKDAYNKLFGVYNHMGRLIQTGSHRVEWLVRPFAVYQETALPIRE